MKQKTDWFAKRQTLRSDADRMVSNLSPTATTVPPAEAMLHELLVHKVELEMQIDELRRAYAAMEEARDRYAEFYEFSPVGYVTLDREGWVDEINPAGAELLGVDHGQPVHRRFAMFVAPQDRDRWHQVFLDLMKQPELEKRTLALEIMRSDNITLHAYLDCRRMQAADDSPMLRLALFDIDKIERAGAEMRTPAPETQAET